MRMSMRMGMSPLCVRSVLAIAIVIVIVIPPVLVRARWMLLFIHALYPRCLSTRFLPSGL